ncbi:acyl-CoA thioesterase [Ferrovibrio sp.]|uniref:acyl-CoA thioesterase n=1 Tax=Ferrovibrio sp. TaxID=1917215 RepID=UPI0035B3810F
MNSESTYTPDHPFYAARIVQWGECDPAGMVYTTQFLDYVMETLEAFWRQVVGFDFQQLHLRHGLGAPTVSSHLDFQHALKAGEPFRVELRIKEIRRATIRFDFRGVNQAGIVCFSADHVSCIVNAAKLKSESVPPFIREPMQAYQQATTKQQ